VVGSKVDVIELSEYPSKEALYDAAFQSIQDGLGEGISGKRKTLLLSGGSTPAPVYKLLSQSDFIWNEVDVGLVDERWVDNTDPASNEKLVRESLLTGHASEAGFFPMKTDAKTADAAVQHVSAVYERFRSPDVVVLGMGPDGHTASWFPDSVGLDEAMSPDTQLNVAAIDASNAPVAGDHPDRLTITLPLVSNAKRVLLLITGEEKRRVLEADTDLPIHKLHRTRPGLVKTLWAP